jgi:hypothetical protein
LCTFLDVEEPGLDLHEWRTRWEELDEALAETVRLIEEMLVERGFQLDEPITAEGEDPEIAKRFLSARETARLVDEGEADPEDVATAIDDLRGIYEYLISDRAPP